jgi:hypothetical protein
MRRGIFSVFRRRSFEVFKLFAFVGCCWLLILWGFSQQSSSKFGEVLDRNQIEENFLRLQQVEERNLEIDDRNRLTFEEEDNNQHKIEVIEADFDDIKEELVKKIEKASNVGRKSFENDMESDIENDIEDNENLWTFQVPPNVFNNNSVGEMGIGWKLPDNLPPDIQKLHDEGWETHQFNQYLSDLISVRRKLPDYRGEYCRQVAGSYRRNLPATSVIM